MSAVHALDAHLAGGATEVARCWRVTRRDGVVFGFTDHDLDLQFDGSLFRAGTGLSAAALSQTTGLSVDNTEGMGALSGDAITEADIAAGRYDGAAVEAWLVQWAAPENRVMQFRGSLGEISRRDGGFSAELRGLAEALNTPRGRIYQKACPAVLGDGGCGVDLSAPGYHVLAVADEIEGARVFWFDGGDVAGFEPRWFERGVLHVESGSGAALSGAIKRDRFEADGRRRVELWDGLRAEIAPGDALRLTAGCDKRSETCRLKFNNLLNYRGFPDIPDEDWILIPPARVPNRITSAGS